MTTKEIREKKSLLRKEYKAIRKSISSEEKISLDQGITQSVLSSMSFKYCNTILLFSSFGDEPDTTKIAKAAFDMNKRVFYPKTQPDGKMEFYRVYSLEDLKDVGMFGIKEPSAHSEIYTYGENNELCLVPGLLFDINGYRIGYGKGYYDRFLSKFCGVSAGIAYSKLITKEHIPYEKRYDKALDIIFSENGVDIVARNK